MSEPEQSEVWILIHRETEKAYFCSDPNNVRNAPACFPESVLRFTRRNGRRQIWIAQIPNLLLDRANWV